MFLTLKSFFVLLLVLSSSIAIKELEETKTFEDCYNLCMDTTAIRNAVPNCTLECKRIFKHLFERKTRR